MFFSSTRNKSSNAARVLEPQQAVHKVELPEVLLLQDVADDGHPGHAPSCTPMHFTPSGGGPVVVVLQRVHVDPWHADEACAQHGHQDLIRWRGKDCQTRPGVEDRTAVLLWPPVSRPLRAPARGRDSLTLSRP
jgi:hypothetical protein